MSTVSYWLANPRGASFPEPVEARRAGAVIAGGGIAGWSLAYWLREKGIDAIVVDPDAVPAGASARNAGFLLAGTSASYEESIGIWGRERARDVETLSWSNRDYLLERILTRHDCEYEATGSWRLAESAEEEAELRRSLELLREDGFGTYEWIDASTARAELHSDRFLGGLAQPRDGMLHSLKLVAAIAAESGQKRFIPSRVTSFRSTGEDVVVSTDQGDIHADLLFLSTNAYLGQLLGAKAGVRPVRAQVLVTEPLKKQIWTRPIYSHYGFFYFRQLPDRRLLIGGARHLFEAGEVGHDDVTTGELQAELERYLASCGIPKLAIDYRWSGVMGFTADSLPRSGSLEGDPRVQLLAGFNGHGVGMAFESARRLVEQVTSR